jgi:hypothetical protein
MVEYGYDGEIVKQPVLFPVEKRIILLNHDESTLYMYDQQKTRWIHDNEKNKPVRKGEGVAIMVSDFTSPDLGWLCSKDGGNEARDGYFSNVDLIKQTENAIDILEDNFPVGNVSGLFAFDNATTHQHSTHTRSFQWNFSI